MASELHTKKPMFFKVILENTIKQQTLEIPSGFVKLFEDCLSNRVILRVPDGSSWEVEMLKVGEEVCFSKGWVEFSEHHCLEHGHLLVFKYEGNSLFDVMIFDLSAVEIDYPGGRDNKYGPKLKKNKEHDARVSDHQHVQDVGGNLASSSKLVDASATNFISSNPWFKIHLKLMRTHDRFLNIPYSFMRKHMEYNSLKKGDVCIFEFVGNNTLKVSIFDSKLHPMMNKNKEVTTLISDQQEVQEFGGNMSSSSKLVDASATNFSSNNPWFKVHVKAVRGKSKYLGAPYSFIEKHMECETKNVMLKVQDKSWPVKLYVSPKAKASGFYSGVPSFTRENSLNKGDACIFEFVGNNTFHVSFFRS
ncbi:B3 domain-containing protein At1g49475 [Euphorbia peplus]|nr:B3 domain-containing protein At1g49475 [Euphorbia peplus]